MDKCKKEGELAPAKSARPCLLNLLVSKYLRVIRARRIELTFMFVLRPGVDCGSPTCNQSRCGDQ